MAPEHLRNTDVDHKLGVRSRGPRHLFMRETRKCFVLFWFFVLLRY